MTQQRPLQPPRGRPRLNCRRETRRDQILDYMIAYAMVNRSVPNTARIAQHFGIAYQTAHKHLLKLVSEHRLLRQNEEGLWIIPDSIWRIHVDPLNKNS